MTVESESQTADMKVRGRPRYRGTIRHRIAALEQIISEGIRREIYETRQQIIAELATERNAQQR